MNETEYQNGQWGILSVKTNFITYVLKGVKDILHAAETNHLLKAPFAFVDAVKIEWDCLLISKPTFRGAKISRTFLQVQKPENER